MEKSLIALALAGGFATGAFAQSNVTLYGVADAGVSLDRSGVPGQSRSLRVNSGMLQGSLLGFTGSEDLGGGNRAPSRERRACSSTAA